jgi:hypothetical protein
MKTVRFLEYCERLSLEYCLCMLDTQQLTMPAGIVQPTIESGDAAYSRDQVFFTLEHSVRFCGMTE